MEIKAELIKPYTDEERMDFIVENNHQKGYIIEETETSLQSKGYTDEELAQQEQERIAMLSLTSADVERGIYKAKGMDFDDILSLVEAQPISEDTPVIDLKALKIELKANNFYRGNPYVDIVGNILGFTKTQLDEFFKTGDYTKLVETAEPTEEIEPTETPTEEVTP